ncbi:MAG TPA: hypothetical protein VNT75_25205, partial [Symbiobacteriaceae bacterium]|nr:hypothetical protein [Symbiobacteriaceae bacterium]
ITGVKNGYTEEALLTNVASAKRGDTELIAVILGMQNLIWTSSMQLLDYGFSHFETRRIVQKGETAGRIPLPNGAGTVTAKAAADLWATVPLGGAAPEQRLVPAEGLAAPVVQGAPVGKLVAVVNGKEAGTIDLIAADAVAETMVATAGPRHDSNAWPWLLVSAVPIALLAMLKRRRRPLS